MAADINKKRYIFTFILLLFSLFFLVVITLSASEIFLTLQQKSQSEETKKEKPIFTKLFEAYTPFSIQHLNPFYNFFFPYRVSDRTLLNNSICSIDNNGLRNPGPEAAPWDKIGFLVGGSSAFGYYATSDNTTINSYLNKMQNRYFLVNAGVPSWNSTQELFRLVNQLLKFKPKIIIAYDGSNDFVITYRYFNRKYYFVPGVPENFDRLEKIVDQATNDALTSKTLFHRFFPKTWLAVGNFLNKSSSNKIETDDTNIYPGKQLQEKLTEAAVKYVDNLKKMNRICEAYNTKFIALFQPNLYAHDKHNLISIDRKKVAAFRFFKREILRVFDGSFEFHDFSNLFDDTSDIVKCYDREGVNDLKDDLIFIDAAHTTDLGNEMIAKRINGLL
jgi:GDSL-like lipase/acylhydrolase family protein